MSVVTIGTRGSALAMRQAEDVAEWLIEAHPGAEVRIEVIRTSGDANTGAPLSAIGGTGLFTKELESALLDGRIDLAVHSMKDLPTTLPDGLIIGAAPERRSPYDAFIATRHASLDALPDGATIGTSSPRRAAQLLAHRPGLRIVDIRGNVDTRLGRVDSGDVDATILACAGLERLERDDAITERLPAEVMMPAVGQGALAIEIRSGDTHAAEFILPLNDGRVSAEVFAERACLRRLEGGCQAPMGALAHADDGELTLRACVCSPDGSKVLRAETTASLTYAEALGHDVADQLLAQGAGAILAAAR